ncbi:hypothetical protein HO133_004654 [Letharia lupina]|uniref:RRM domain-containing protein n=1 Tax=Letharia lupina TaxID=560253 RepID=A0A8H6FKP7_9LECA|nr:uncharacterized protein HO133_004654 [Letharia lupina]KAF6230314.1 hypothetical protein HO133_004654 [Letharia lupina]
MCPFRNKADAWDAYYKIHHYVWRHEGYETVLQASLYLFDKTTGNMKPLTEFGFDGAIPSTFVSQPVNFVPAGTMHAHPGVRPSGSIQGNRRSANQRGPRSAPGHAFNPTLANPYPPSWDFMPPPPAFVSPMADSSMQTGIIPASQLSPGAAGVKSCPQFYGQAPPYLYNSPEIAGTSRSSSISTMSNTLLASCGSSYVALTDDGTTSIPGTPYASHNVSTSSERSHAYPGTPSSSPSQYGPLGISQGTERDQGYKIIIRHVGPGVTPEDLSKLLDKKMPRYVQHKKPKPGEDNKWSVTFSKEADANIAVERLRGCSECSFQGKKLQVIPDTSGAARRHKGSGAPILGASSSSTARGPTIVDGSLPG